MKIKPAFLSNHWAKFEACKLVGIREIKIHQHNVGHMTKMAPMPIMVKSL